jgi:ubiquinone/menaquinone biosynthesis C-methylase UbiE
MDMAATNERKDKGRMSGREGGVARVYDRVAPLYDWYEAPMDALGGRTRRRRVIEGARGDVLEVGVGTGRNLELYPQEVRVTGIDISERMLDRARRRAASLGRDVDLQWGDVEALPYDDARFDTVTATCVFCSVEDPLKGLGEVRRVVKPDGEVRLLEHVRPRNPVLGRIFDWMSPITRRLMGPEMNRRTEETVRAAGLTIESVRRQGIWREIVARPAG